MGAESRRPCIGEAQREAVTPVNDRQTPFKSSSARRMYHAGMRLGE